MTNDGWRVSQTIPQFQPGTFCVIWNLSFIHFGSKHSLLPARLGRCSWLGHAGIAIGVRRF
jgi:hypothetical protein